MGLCTVGISDIRISNSVGESLITYSLGSCIGVAVYDPVQKLGGMIHYMLPQSKISPEKAMIKPAMFADTGIPLLLDSLCAEGAAKDRLILKVAGGAQLMDDNKLFNIGERNFLMLRKIIWTYNILIRGQHVGGNIARTLKLDIATGKVVVKFAGGEIEI